MYRISFMITGIVSGSYDNDNCSGAITVVKGAVIYRCGAESSGTDAVVYNSGSKNFSTGAIAYKSGAESFGTGAINYKRGAEKFSTGVPTINRKNIRLNNKAH